MLTDAPAFSGYSSNDIPAARTFYGRTLGLAVTDENDMLTMRFPGGHTVIIYPKPDHQPATFTVLNFSVDDVGAAAARLASAGVALERYEGFGQDDDGVMRGQGPDIAWFKDPAGNILSIIGDRP